MKVCPSCPPPKTEPPAIKESPPPHWQRPLHACTQIHFNFLNRTEIANLLPNTLELSTPDFFELILLTSHTSQFYSEQSSNSTQLGTCPMGGWHVPLPHADMCVGNPDHHQDKEHHTENRKLASQLVLCVLITGHTACFTNEIHNSYYTTCEILGGGAHIYSWKVLIKVAISLTQRYFAKLSLSQVQVKFSASPIGNWDWSYNHCETHPTHPTPDKYIASTREAWYAS